MDTRQYQRSIKNSVRELDRVRKSLEGSEKERIADMKKAAKNGDMDAMINAQGTTSGHIMEMHKLTSHMEMILLQLSTMQSSQQMAAAMKGIYVMMGKMNAKLNLPQIQKVWRPPRCMRMRSISSRTSLSAVADCGRL